MISQESQQGGSVSYQNIHEALFSVKLYEHLHKFWDPMVGRKSLLASSHLANCSWNAFKENSRTFSIQKNGRIFTSVLSIFSRARSVMSLYVLCACLKPWHWICCWYLSHECCSYSSKEGVMGTSPFSFFHSVCMCAKLTMHTFLYKIWTSFTSCDFSIWCGSILILLRVVGNSNAIMQSEDWDALITDAKSRNCFMEMENIPRELLVLKGSTYTSGNASSNSTRSLRFDRDYGKCIQTSEANSGTHSRWHEAN